MKQTAKRPDLRNRIKAARKSSSGPATKDDAKDDENQSTEASPQVNGRATASFAKLFIFGTRPRRAMLLALVLLLTSLCAGFQHFVLTLPKTTSDELQFTDGIVVMTGGSQRLDSGLNLLTNGFAGKMLISGVGVGVNRAILVQELDLSENEVNALFCCVELDHDAQDTKGNADIARQWAQLHDMKSLRLVTANYHMPRALLVFSRAIPNVDLYQWPVSPDDLDLGNWWRDPVALRVLIREYAKYLAVYFGG